MVRRRSSGNLSVKENGGDVSLTCSASPSHVDSVTADAVQIKNKYCEVRCPFVEVGCTKVETNRKSRKKHAKYKETFHASLLLKHVLQIQRHIPSVINAKESVITHMKEIKLEKTDLASVDEILLQCMKCIETAQDRMSHLEVSTRKCREDLQMLKGDIHPQLYFCSPSHPSGIVDKLDDIESRNRTIQISAEENIKKICNLETKVNNNSQKMEIATNKIAALKMRMLDMVMIEEPKKKVSDEQNLLYMNAVLLPNILGIFHPALDSEDYMVSYDGVLLWKIANYHYHSVQAKEGKEHSLCSPIMFTDTVGYKLISCVFLNGNGLGQGNHISVQVSVLPGPHDALLEWPFRKKVTFTLIDQNNIEHHVREYLPEFTDPAFRRPSAPVISLRGCPQFIYKEDLYERGFVKNDVMFIRISVEK